MEKAKEAAKVKLNEVGAEELNQVRYIV